MGEVENQTKASAVKTASVQVSPIETAKSYLKGVALKVEQVRDLVKQLKQIDLFGLAILSTQLSNRLRILNPPAISQIAEQ